MHTKARGSTCIGRDLNETVLWGVTSSRGLKWQNKTYKLKRSNDFQSFSFQYGPLSFLLPLLQYFPCNSPIFSSHRLVRAQGAIGRATRRALFSPLLKQRRYSCSGPSKELTLLLEMSFKFPFNLFGKLTLAFLKSRSLRILKSWYTGSGPEQGFRCCCVKG